MATSMASLIKAYALPLILFSISVLYQTFLLPRAFPPSHYEVLGVKTYSSIDDVKDAYEKHSSKWKSGTDVISTSNFIEITYAYELLTNPLWKRDYDIFDIDENIHLLNEFKAQYAEKSISHVDLPLLAPTSPDPGSNTLNAISTQNFGALFNSSKPWLIQVYSLGSNRCTRFFSSWKEVAALLEGVANTGVVELGDVQLAMLLAERKPTGKFFFRKGLPSLVAVPPGCKTLDCLLRFEGVLSVDAITDWFATTVLGLPRILYYSRESLVQNFLAKVGPHKVKVIFFSKTGERATPFVRQAAKNYWAYASFAFVLWREEDFSVWWNAFEVESAPAIVFVKDPGVKPVVFHGSVNSSWFLDIVEKNKQQVLPQLRSVTSMALGCDARGYSRAGNDTVSWYCVILAGRLSPELNKMREVNEGKAENTVQNVPAFLSYAPEDAFCKINLNEGFCMGIPYPTMRRVQEISSKESELSTINEELSSLLATTLSHKRLTFAWLDGEAQQKYCLFHLHSETSYETCGPRRDLTETPRLFIVRYMRNATASDFRVDKKPKTIWNVLEDDEVDPASQLVARYNGSNEIPEIIRWIAETIRDGETRNLPFFRAKAPDLVPEDSEPIWSRGAQTIVSKSSGMKHRINQFISRVKDYAGDPRIGPLLLLGSLMLFGATWLKRSQPTHPPPSTEGSQPSSKDEARAKRRERARQEASSRDRPSSITDVEPENAYQMPLPDSDSE